MSSKEGNSSPIFYLFLTKLLLLNGDTEPNMIRGVNKKFPLR